MDAEDSPSVSMGEDNEEPLEKKPRNGKRKLPTRSTVTNDAILDRLNSLYKFSSESQERIEVKISTVQEQNSQLLKTQLSHTEEINEIKSNQNSLKMRLNAIEQKDLSLHMDITGIHRNKILPNVNIKDLVIDLLKSFKIQLASSDIVRTFVRFYTKNEEKVPVIVVVFANYDEKIHIMREKRKVDPHGNSKIFFSHSLTPFNRMLLAKARERGKSSNYPYVFFANGKIIMKRENDAKGVIIKSVEDLEKVGGSSQQFHHQSQQSQQHLQNPSVDNTPVTSDSLLQPNIFSQA